MAMGPLNRNKTLTGMVRTSKWGRLMDMEALVGRVRVSKRGWLMAMGPLQWSRTLTVRVRMSKW